MPEQLDNAYMEGLMNHEAFVDSLLDIEFSTWHSDLRNLIKYTAGPFHPWPLYAMPPSALNWKPVPGVTLIGDAAHVSTPWQVSILAYKPL